MNSLPIELQELILEKVDSKTLYDFTRSAPNEMITNVLERRTITIIRRLEDALKTEKNTFSIEKVPDDYKQHMRILLSVIYLPNLHPLVNESIEHLIARYPTPENSISIDENVKYLIDRGFDYSYEDYSMFNSRKGEKYFNKMRNTIAKSGNYTTFEQQFYFLCKILIEYYNNDYSKLGERYYHEPDFEGFYQDLNFMLGTAMEFINDPDVDLMFDTLIHELDYSIAQYEPRDYDAGDAEYIGNAEYAE